MKQYDINTLDKLVAEGKLMMQTHPTLPLRIYKYTPELQFSKGFDALTSRCRGLVVDNDGFQYSNPIPKFHNIEELQADPSFQLPNLPYEITDKVDGSCIEVFWYKNQWIVCTLGSFTSDQAIYAEQMLKTKYAHLMKNLEIGKTYIFELIC